MQNAVPQQQIGVATSTATFTRQIGGALGTAVFLSILFSTAGEKIESLRCGPPCRPPTSRRPCATRRTPRWRSSSRPPRRAAAPARPSGVLQDSSFLNDLDERLAKPFLMGFSEAMDLVFLVGACVMVVGFLVMLLLPHVELRKSSAYGDREGQGTADAPAVAAH